MARDFPGDGSNFVSTNGPSGSLDITGSLLTIAMWVSLESPISSILVAKCFTDSSQCQYLFRIDGATKLRFGTGDGSGSPVEAAGATIIPESRWVHLAGVRNGTTNYVYVDGKLDGSVSAPDMAHSAFNIRFGSIDGSTSGADGRMAHLGFWNAALTGRELELLARGLPPLDVRSINLKVYFPFNDYGASGQAYDVMPGHDILTIETGAIGLAPDPPFIANRVITYMPVEVGEEAPDIPEETIDSATVSLVITITAVEEKGTEDSASVYLTLTASGVDIYSPPCFIIGEGDARLRWSASDDFLRWLASDANLRWEARMILGTGQC